MSAARRDSGPRGADGRGVGPADPGLCGRCRHARRQPGARGSSFWRCGRADSDPRFLRYPPLPVLDCKGFGAVDDRC